jgi:chorismate mutase
MSQKKIIEKAEDLAKGAPMPPDAVGRIFQKVVEEMRDWEAKLDSGTQ